MKLPMVVILLITMLLHGWPATTRDASWVANEKAANSPNQPEDLVKRWTVYGSISCVWRVLIEEEMRGSGTDVATLSAKVSVEKVGPEGESDLVITDLVLITMPSPRPGQPSIKLTRLAHEKAVLRIGANGEVLSSSMSWGEAKTGEMEDLAVLLLRDLIQRRDGAANGDGKVEYNISDRMGKRDMVGRATSEIVEGPTGSHIRVKASSEGSAPEENFISPVLETKTSELKMSRTTELKGRPGAMLAGSCTSEGERTWNVVVAEKRRGPWISAFHEIKFRGELHLVD